VAAWVGRQSWRATKATGRASWKYAGRPLLNVTERRAAARSTTKARPWVHEAPDLDGGKVDGRVTPAKSVHQVDGITSPRRRNQSNPDRQLRARVHTNPRTADYIGGRLMSELKPLVQAADRLADLVPESAGELDQVLAGLSVATLRIAEALAQFAENVDSEIGLDPRVSAPLYAMADQWSDSAAGGKQARQAFRSLYASQLENEVRQPKVPGFFEDH
jgi:hypothetical protein